MTIQPGANLYTQGFGSAPENVEVPHVDVRNPTTTDTNYPIGKRWIDRVNNETFTLTSLTSSGGVLSANWEGEGGGTVSVSTLTGDSGTATPASGNILIAGGTNITTAAAGSTVTVNLDAAPTGLTSVTATSFITSSATLGTTWTANSFTPTGSDADISLLLNGKGTGSVVHSRGLVGGDITIEATNTDNTSGTSNAGFEVATGGASGGDPYVQFAISGVGASTMTMGLDNSASDIFVISNSTAIGTSNALTLTQAGALSATTTITAGTGITSTTGDIVATAGNISTTAGSITSATTLTATLGNIQATNGNLVLNTEGNKIVSTSVGTTTAAGANSFGSVTLAGGTATVATTSVTANSLIVIWRQSIGATGAAALGHLTVGTIVAATSFVINAVQAADATALQASDVSVVGWMIIN